MEYNKSPKLYIHLINMFGFLTNLSSSPSYENIDAFEKLALRACPLHVIKHLRSVTALFRDLNRWLLLAPTAMLRNIYESQ